MTYNLLALDASTEALSIAIQFNGQTVKHFEVCPQQHSQKVLPLVSELLEKVGCKLQDLDGIVFGRGPGSFTGVRISVAIAQGLAYGANLPLVGVSTLQAMAQQALEEKELASVITGIDARMGEIYFAHYHKSETGLAELHIEENEVVCAPADLPESIRGLTAVGTAWEPYAEQAAKSNLDVIPEITLPDAAYMLKIAEVEFEKGNTVQAADAQPHYVRDTVTWKKLPGRE
ncbi:tRNA (adenosine(37)-N6)-threonylcarbamoyltransferase complex dimerization subunit type 1 TsaB [Pseudoalteromonas phenolica]|uniref:tRNA threonylcarbamoyladenosine biosynthesis protein TsaB n=1 Tax=Pseudoalteromonas phenolica TaxID=161398 RepID=A0A4Q7INM6_9GAMM|nr:tRNA (adenosine(37)-N6)-threonylcarbamoyltransferase complex dimerization subunit type 1 TsaB [Pseudoalteromonas phenolica]RZQ53963.1 tRNA (adenosine(37)-N6)-threonylcarbamoyltransferase complex dimerization subunit type 1 TsaB [Pseudoalteromonas phenolica]